MGYLIPKSNNLTTLTALKLQNHLTSPSQNRTKIVINQALSVSECVVFRYIVHWDMLEQFKESQSWQTITCRYIESDILRDKTAIIAIPVPNQVDWKPGTSFESVELGLLV